MNKVILIIIVFISIYSCSAQSKVSDMEKEVEKYFVNLDKKKFTKDNLINVNMNIVCFDLLTQETLLSKEVKGIYSVQKLESHTPKYILLISGDGSTKLMDYSSLSNLLTDVTKFYQINNISESLIVRYTEAILEEYKETKMRHYPIKCVS